MLVERTNSNALAVNPLPDGSKVIVDSENQRVFALNTTAGAAWDACITPATLSSVAENMRRSFDPAITEELAEEAILQLRKQKLVQTSGSSSQGTRRQFIATLGAIAVPSSSLYRSLSSGRTPTMQGPHGLSISTLKKIISVCGFEVCFARSMPKTVSGN
ncbi:PqqD family protein [Tunturiibacter gelidiferens]|uniref:PqqD family protein n=1 Tax=Tunturiibacter gelidiferens TaxID=3069689 RepID=UPI003D9BF252